MSETISFKETTQRRILLLDDERLVRFTIGAYLRHAGFAVTEAATPEEAILHIRRVTFHAVVSDVMMGEVDGFMFRDMLRKFDSTVPVVFLTSMLNDGSNTFLERLMEDLYSFYVSKSAPRAVLIAKLEQVVNSHMAELNVRAMEGRLKKSLSLASLVQKAMLPAWTHLGKGYTYTSCWQPFNEVSGDLFEWYHIDQNADLFVFGDISGHGTNAALAMTATQAFLKQCAYFEDSKARQVHKIAKRIQDFFIDNLNDIAYMVTTIVYLNPQEHIIRYINCGNPEPLCISRKDGSRVEMNPEHLGAIPAGLFKDTEYSESDVVEYNMREEDVIMIMSDGIFDISQDEVGNETPPQDILEELCSVAATGDDDTMLISAIPYRIIHALEGMGYSHQQDDISFFVLGRLFIPENTKLIEIKMTPTMIDNASHEAGDWVEEKTANAELGVKTDLLLNEHLMNIYRHGLDDFGRQHEVSILSLSLREHYLDIVVWDRGTPWTDIVHATEAEADEQLNAQNASLAGGGRGRPIMRKIAESISSERFMNLNKTNFHISIQEAEK